MQLIAVGTSEEEPPKPVIILQDAPAIGIKYAENLKKPANERVAAMEQLCNDVATTCVEKYSAELKLNTLKGEQVKKMLPAIQKFGCKTPKCAADFLQGENIDPDTGKNFIEIVNQVCTLMKEAVEFENKNDCKLDS